jgi:hypothetical protein
LAKRRFPRPTFASWLYAYFSLFSLLLPVFPPFFSLFRGDSSLDNLPKTICFQMVD